MATVKSIKGGIKADMHIANAIEYITKHEKTKGLVTMFNCYGDEKNITSQFKYTRQIFGKDKGVLAHHYCHSFSPDDDVTPEQVHKLTLDLVQKIAGDNFQYLIATHSDKDHIHSHIVINSVNMVTGKKWLGNQTTLKAMRKESDRLCIENNLSIVKEPGKKGMDFTTYQMAMQGKSWKVNLVRDLDEILKNRTTQNEFIKLLEEKGYYVKFTGKNITVSIGQKKIRLTTLSKEFGEKYSSKSIFSQLGIKYDETIKTQKEKTTSSRNKKYKENNQKNQWQKQEEDYFKHNDEYIFFPDWFKSKTNFEADPCYFSNYFEKYMRVQKALKKNKPFTSAEKRWFWITKTNEALYGKTSQCGNVSSEKLKNMEGSEYSIKLFAYQLPRLQGIQCFYSVSLNKGTGIATVSVKDYNKYNLLNHLNLSNHKMLDEQSDRIKNREVYETIKKQCQQAGTKIAYRTIQSGQLGKLKHEGIYFSVLEKDGKTVIAFNPVVAEQVHSALSENQNSNYKSEYRYNRDILDSLKKKSAIQGVKLSYTTITSDTKNRIYDKFYTRESDKRFAAFKVKGSDNYTLVYLETDMEIKNTLPPKQVQQTKTSTNK